MATLILLRHGHSDWNEKNLFTGWVDVDLAPDGVEQAKVAGLLLKEKGLLPTVLHTSLLLRAIRTANLTLEACERSWVPVKRHWRLNERHYGALQGLDKTATREKYGDEQFMTWRRSYDVPPPPIEEGSEWDNRSDVRYAKLARDLVPLTECLQDVVHRLLPYWYDAIVPDLRACENGRVAAHGNSLRALVAHLDGLSREEVLALNIPTGQPLRYDLDDDLQPTVRGGVYLDPEAAAAAAAAVANQGKA